METKKLTYRKALESFIENTLKFDDLIQKERKDDLATPYDYFEKVLLFQKLNIQYEL